MNEDLFQFAVDPVATLERRIGEVIVGKSGPYPLPTKGRELMEILKFHKGSNHAKPLADLAASLQVADREIKSLVKLLVEDFDIPIGASRQKPWGYFICVTADDRELARRPLVHELTSLARRIKALDGEHELREVMGQLKLEMEKAR